MSRSVSLTAALLCGAFVFPGVLQAQDPADQIKYRQNFMKSLGGHVGDVSLILRGKVAQNAHLMMHVQAIAAATSHIHDVFPEGSDLGETDAKAEIWEKPDEFKAAADKAAEAGAAFLSAVEGGDQAHIGEAMKNLGGSCKNCHDDFRVKRE